MKRQVVYYKNILSNFVTQTFGITILTSLIKFKYRCLSYIRHSKKRKKKTQAFFVNLFVSHSNTWSYIFCIKVPEIKKVKKS